MEPMHPYVVDRLIRDHQQDLARLRADGPHGNRVGGDAVPVGQWRRRLGRALLAGAVTVGVPRGARRPARQSVTALLGLGCGPADGS